MNSLPSELVNKVRTLLPFNDKKNLDRVSKYVRGSIGRNISKEQLKRESVEYYSNLYQSLNPRSKSSFRDRKLWGYEYQDYEGSSAFVPVTIVGGTKEFPFTCSIVQIAFKDYTVLRIAMEGKNTKREDLPLQQKALCQLTYFYLFHLVGMDKSVLHTPLHIQLLIEDVFPVIVNASALQKIFSYTLEEFIDLVEIRFSIEAPSDKIDEEILIETYLSYDKIQQVSDKTQLLSLKDYMFNMIEYNESVLKYEENNIVIDAFSFKGSTRGAVVEFKKNNVELFLKSIDRYMAYFLSTYELQMLAVFIAKLAYIFAPQSNYIVDLFGAFGQKAEILDTKPRPSYININLDVSNVDVLDTIVHLTLLLAAKNEQFKEYTLNHVINIR